MPEVDYLLSDVEQRSLFESIFSNNGEIVPSLRYSTNEFQCVNDAERAMAFAASDELRGPMFVISPSFTRYPLMMSELQSNDRRFYVLRDRYGGPYIDLMPSRMFVDRKPPLLRSGFLAYYRSYYLSGSDKEIAATDELKAFFKSLKSRLRSCTSLATTRSGRRYYVGLEALHLLQLGVATNVEGLDLSSVA